MLENENEKIPRIVQKFVHPLELFIARNLRCVKIYPFACEFVVHQSEKISQLHITDSFDYTEIKLRLNIVVVGIFASLELSKQSWMLRSTSFQNLVHMFPLRHERRNITSNYLLNAKIRSNGITVHVMDSCLRSRGCFLWFKKILKEVLLHIISQRKGLCHWKFFRKKVRAILYILYQLGFWNFNNLYYFQACVCLRNIFVIIVNYVSTFH